MSQTKFAQCFKANRLRGLMSGGSIFDIAKSSIGNSLGQLAFKKIDQFIPKDLVGANVNSNVRALVDAVRTGAVAVGRNGSASILGSVFDAAGVDPALNPKSLTDGTIFQDGKAAGSFIAEKLVNGTIEELDLPGPIGSLAKMAFVQQNYRDPLPSELMRTPDCSPTPYAMDLLAYAPKHNFMFLVEFVFQPDYNSMSTDNADKSQTIKFHYLCRTFQRPDVTVEHEDINMYNFRTKVAKRVTYNPVTIKMFDDIKNSSMEFAEKYLKSVSPIANVGPDKSALMEYHGMNFETAHKVGSKGPELPGGTGSLGGFINNNTSILRLVNVYHVFAFGKRVNSYTLINPKIQRLVMSDFSMEEQDIASIEMELTYDSYYIQTNVQDIGPKELQDRSELGIRHIKKFG